MVTIMPSTLVKSLFIGCAMLANGSISAASKLQNLDPFLWENRLILVSTPVEGTDALLSVLAENDEAIVDRHIIWFVVNEETVISNYQGPLDSGLVDSLSAYWKTGFPADQQIVLIGKDGGSKLRQAELDLPVIFTTIDGMPMRQAEMRRSQRFQDQRGRDD